MPLSGKNKTCKFHFKLDNQETPLFTVSLVTVILHSLFVGGVFDLEYTYHQDYHLHFMRSNKYICTYTFSHKILVCLPGPAIVCWHGSLCPCVTTDWEVEIAGSVLLWKLFDLNGLLWNSRQLLRYHQFKEVREFLFFSYWLAPFFVSSCVWNTCRFVFLRLSVCLSVSPDLYPSLSLSAGKLRLVVRLKCYCMSGNNPYLLARV